MVPIAKNFQAVLVLICIQTKWIFPYKFAQMLKIDVKIFKKINVLKNT